MPSGLRMPLLMALLLLGLALASLSVRTEETRDLHTEMKTAADVHMATDSQRVIDLCMAETEALVRERVAVNPGH